MCSRLTEEETEEVKQLAWGHGWSQDLQPSAPAPEPELGREALPSRSLERRKELVPAGP